MKVETTVLQEDIDLKGELNKFWQLDSLGIIDDIASGYDVYCNFNRKIKFNGIRFQEQHTLIPNNYGLCRNRLYSLLQTLRQRPEILREYNEIINQQLQSGAIEVVNDPHEKIQPGSIHYIPHKEILRSEHCI